MRRTRFPADSASKNQTRWVVMTEKEKKLSPMEPLKASSNYLRGTIAEELAQGGTSFGKDSSQLLKFHGTYQQDNRDDRGQVSEKGKKREKSYSFMVRTRIPGGKLSGDQLLAEIDLCDEVGNTTLRITTRQGLQLHGVLKSNLRRVIHRINEVQLSTLAACGDVSRNVMCCPAPHHHDPVHAELQEVADRLAAHMAPRTTAYHELWLSNGQGGAQHLVGGGGNGHEIEPIYGETYLPRKFKIGVALPGDNCIDLYAQDLGLMAICEDSKIIGYNVLVGGGFGVTPSAKKTFAAVAKRMTFVPPDRVLDITEAVVKVQRDFGNRADRKTARMKYLIANWGLERFKAKVEEYYGQSLPEPHPADVHGFDDHMGWHGQGDGRWYYGLNIENGRIKNEGDFRLKTALREICSEIKLNIRLTSHQSLIFCDVEESDRETIETTLHEHGVKLSNEISTVRRWSMACPAWPTCGLAITESERALPGFLDKLEVELERLGLADEVFTIRMTGCPNGCARPFNADVGLVGKAKGKYTVLLGGRTIGDRLNSIYKDMVPAAEVVPTLVAALSCFKENRQAGETFGDFCHRQGNEKITAWTDENAPQSAT